MTIYSGFSHSSWWFSSSLCIISGGWVVVSVAPTIQLALICFHSWRLDPKQKKQKTKSFTRPLSSFSDPLYGSKLFFLFSRGFGHFVSPTMSVAHFFCFCFPFPWVLGINFHPDKHPLAQLSPLHILYWCLHWVSDFGYWAIRENVQ